MNALVRLSREALKASAGLRGYASSSEQARKVAVLGAAGGCQARVWRVMGVAGAPQPPGDMPYLPSRRRRPRRRSGRQGCWGSASGLPQWPAAGLLPDKAARLLPLLTPVACLHLTPPGGIGQPLSLLMKVAAGAKDGAVGNIFLMHSYSNCGWLGEWLFAALASVQS